MRFVSICIDIKAAHVVLLRFISNNNMEEIHKDKRNIEFLKFWKFNTFDFEGNVRRKRAATAALFNISKFLIVFN